jgi:histone H3/H4
MKRDEWLGLLAVRRVLKVFLDNVIRDAVTFTEHSKMKTVMSAKDGGGPSML